MTAARYVFQKRLGGGGMAEVFLATAVGAEGFARPVAIKRVLPSFSEDPTFAAMFVNEARLSAILRHSNIVQVLDFDRDADGRLFLVMELVEGRDLDDLARSGPLPLPIVVHVIAEVLDGLAYANEMKSAEGQPLGIVHRDISPHNVLLSWDGAVKVSDFGIAKAMLASGAGQSGMIKGKPMYMAPEQVTSPGSVDGRADVFAVGVVLYELVTGQSLYQGTTNEEILTDVIQIARGWRAVVPPQVLRPDLPWDLGQVVLQMTAPDRAQRFETARAALDALLRTASAPMRGATLLKDCLAERFPTEAQARGRVSAPHTPPGVPITGGGAGAGTGAPMGTAAAQPRAQDPMTMAVPGNTGAPVTVALGSLVSPVAAGTVPTQLGRPPRRGLGAAIVIAAGLVIASVVIATVLATRPGAAEHASVAVDAQPHAVSPADASVPINHAPADAAVTAPVDAAAAVIIVDAGPPIDARPRRSEPADDRPRGSGTLIVSARPWAIVSIDGRSLGQTPVSRSIPAGRHKLTLERPDGTKEVLKIEISADEEKRVDRNYQ